MPLEHLREIEVHYAAREVGAVLVEEIEAGAIAVVVELGDQRIVIR